MSSPSIVYAQNTPECLVVLNIKYYFSIVHSAPVFCKQRQWSSFLNLVKLTLNTIAYPLTQKNKDQTTIFNDNFSVKVSLNSQALVSSELCFALTIRMFVYQRCALLLCYICKQTAPIVIA